MRENVLNKMMNFIDDGSYSNEELEKIHYGFEAIYVFITKSIVIFITTYFLGILKYTLMFLGTYGLIRTFACGLHANKSSICMIASLIIFIIIPYLCKIVIMPWYLKIILATFSLFHIYKFAPADTKKRPIINKNKRKYLKLISIFIAIIYSIFSFTLHNQEISNSLILALTLESFMISPYVYKLLNLSYDNYKSYK